MNYLTLLMDHIDLSTIILLSLIGIISVVIRKLYLKIYPDEAKRLLPVDIIQKWKIAHIVVLVICLILVTLKGIVIGYNLKLQADKKEELVHQPPIVKVEKVAPVAVVSKVMNKEIFSLCLDKARTKEGVPVEAIKACTDASLFQVHDVK